MSDIRHLDDDSVRFSFQGSNGVEKQAVLGSS